MISGQAYLFVNNLLFQVFYFLSNASYCTFMLQNLFFWLLIEFLDDTKIVLVFYDLILHLDIIETLSDGTSFKVLQIRLNINWTYSILVAHLLIFFMHKLVPKFNYFKHIFRFLNLAL